MEKKNKFVLNSAKILSPDQTDVLQNAQELTQIKAHGRCQCPCVNIVGNFVRCCRKWMFGRSSL